MGYTNVSGLLGHFEQNVNNDYVNNPNFVTGLKTRAANLLMAPLFFATTAIDTMIGVGAGMANVCTGLSSETLSQITSAHVRDAELIFAKPFLNLHKVINPSFKLTAIDPVISCYGNGLYTDSVYKSFGRQIEKCTKSNSSIVKNVVSRFLYSQLALACVVSRVVDGIIGVPAAALSLLTAGKIKSLNNLAFRGLQAPALLSDFVYCATKIINPKAVI